MVLTASQTREFFDKAQRYLSRFGEDTTRYVVMDIDGEDIVFYSNKPLSDYDSADGVHTKRIRYDDLNEADREVLKQWLIMGPTAESCSDEGEARKHWEIDILGVRSGTTKGLEQYSVIPTRELAEAVFAKYPGDPNQLNNILDHDCYTFPMDAIMVHEGFHGGIGFYYRYDLYQELSQRGYFPEDGDYDIIDELFSMMGDLFYLREYYSELAYSREMGFDELSRKLNRFEREKTEAMGTHDETVYQNVILGPHSYAARIYSSIKADPNFWLYVNMMFSEPVEDS